MFNKIILVGRLTADPELRQTQSGAQVASFSVACQRPFTNGGERRTDFINVVAWRRSAEFVTRYFHKGNAIGVEGRLEMRDYTDRDGNNRRVYEVIADNIFFVESRGAAQQNSDAPVYTAPAAPAAPAANISYSSGSADDFQEIDLDEDLPF